MSLVAAYHHATEAVLTLTGFSDKAAHLNVGLGLYVGLQLALRTRRASLEALLVVLGCECVNEALDALFVGEIRWADTLGDMGATLAWPTILFLASRHRRRRWARDAVKAPQPSARRTDATARRRQGGHAPSATLARACR